VYTHSESLIAGTRLRSLLTGREYLVVNDYDPDDISRNATVTIALIDCSERAWRDRAFAVLADRIEQDFEIVK